MTTIVLTVALLAVFLLDIHRAKSNNVEFDDRLVHIERRIDNSSVAITRDLKWHNDRIASLAERVAELEKERKLQLDLAGGGVWRTQSGYTLRIRDMSTNHLQNTLKLFCSKKTQEPFVSMQKELNRRAEDQEWQKRTEAHAEMQRKWELECAEELGAIKAAKTKVIATSKKQVDVLVKLDTWLATKAGRGIGISTIRKKILELLK